MPFVQHARREIHVKVVYYGPGLGGKTTNLEWIHAHTRPEMRGKLVALQTEVERTLFFDLLPVEIGRYKSYGVRLHLCTVPGQIAHDRTRQLVLRHVDGIVFVVDSQESRLDDNVESILNLAANLRLQGDDPDRMPLVVQYNKRDLPNSLSTETLHEALRIPEGVPEVEGAAVRGVGVFETLKVITKACLGLVPYPALAPDGRSPSILPGKRSSMFPDRPAPLRDSSPGAEPLVTIPRPSRVPAEAVEELPPEPPRAEPTEESVPGQTAETPESVPRGAEASGEQPAPMAAAGEEAERAS